jgi:hypothetical protein
MLRFVSLQLYLVIIQLYYLQGVSPLLSHPVSIFKLQDKHGLSPSHLQPVLSTQFFEPFDSQGSTVETHTWSVFFECNLL